MTTPDAWRILHTARLNKGTAFTEAERERLGITGLLPDGVEGLDTQLLRMRAHLDAKPTALERYIYLSELQDRNEHLFYSLLRSDLPAYMPLVYTPTVGEACQRFGHIMRRPKGLYISMRRKGRVAEILRNWPERDVRFIVVTDGERILGLGDLGVCGMGIPVGKLALYTACAGVPPEACLPVVLDVGTNNESFLADPLYPGARHLRVSGEEYFDFVDEFVEAVQEVFPRACIQFEDFTNKTAIPLLERYRDRVCCFNDDIQGTASVAVAGLFGAARMMGSAMRDHRYLFFGAGSAAVGIADLICMQLMREGLPEGDARARCWFMNSKGLITNTSPGLADYQQRYAHPFAGGSAATLIEAVRAVRPSVLIGVSTVAKAFTEEVIREMASLNRRPVIFPYSNPTSRSECTAEEAIQWSDGRAIFASGSPFPPLHHQGRLFVPGQGNNVYIYPAVGLAVYATGARRVTDEMFLVAAEALAERVTEQDLDVGLIYPPMSGIVETSSFLAARVARLIVERGLATEPAAIDGVAHMEELIHRVQYDPHYPSMLG
jgi:malate dehydrogenase (oxaloacetate-decarboxylating)(NADP+)